MSVKQCMTIDDIFLGWTSHVKYRRNTFSETVSRIWRCLVCTIQQNRQAVM